MRKKYYRTVTWSELTEVAERRPGASVPDTSDAASQRTGEGDWHGGSFSEAMHRLRYGWLEGVAQAEAILAGAQGQAPAPCFELDVAGYFPLVPAYVAGDPACMMDRIEDEQPRTRLALALNAVYSACVTSEQVMCYAAAVSVVLAEIEASGTDVALYTLDSGGTDGFHHVYAIPVREFGEPLDMSRIVFAFHPAFLRRALFAHREMRADLSQHGLARHGYGQPLEIEPADVAATVGGIGVTPVALPSVGTVLPDLSKARHAALCERLRAVVREEVAKLAA
jgi:hypothetical protein